MLLSLALVQPGQRNPDPDYSTVCVDVTSELDWGCAVPVALHWCTNLCHGLGDCKAMGIVILSAKLRSHFGSSSQGSFKVDLSCMTQSSCRMDREAKDRRWQAQELLLKRLYAERRLRVGGQKLSQQWRCFLDHDILFEVNKLLFLKREAGGAVQNARTPGGHLFEVLSSTPCLVGATPTGRRLLVAQLCPLLTD